MTVVDIVIIGIVIVVVVIDLIVIVVIDVSAVILGSVAIIVLLLTLSLFNIRHCTHLQRVSTAKSLFEEERGTTTLNSARGHDCNSVSKHISLLLMKWVRKKWQGNCG